MIGHYPKIRTSTGTEAPWEIDPRKLIARKIFGERGIVLRTATSALQVGDHILMGSMDDDRIGVYQQH